MPGAVLVPFWSPYPQAAPPQDTKPMSRPLRRIGKGTRGGPAETTPRDDEALMKMASHQGFSVGMTVCWIRTSVTGVSRHRGQMSHDMRE